MYRRTAAAHLRPMALYFLTPPERLYVALKVAREDEGAECLGMNETKIEPAMTPEEWGADLQAIECHWRIGQLRYTVAAEVLPDGTRGVSLCYPGGTSIVGTWIPPEKVPAVAALCLHGQPFGFTWEDVDRLRWIIRRGASAGLGTGLNGTQAVIKLEELADRIAALLPPRESAVAKI